MVGTLIRPTKHPQGRTHILPALGLMVNLLVSNRRIRKIRKKIRNSVALTIKRPWSCPMTLVLLTPPTKQSNVRTCVRKNIVSLRYMP